MPHQICAAAMTPPDIPPLRVWPGPAGLASWLGLGSAWLLQICSVVTVLCQTLITLGHCLCRTEITALHPALSVFRTLLPHTSLSHLTAGSPFLVQRSFLLTEKSWALKAVQISQFRNGYVWTNLACVGDDKHDVVDDKPCHSNIRMEGAQFPHQYAQYHLHLDMHPGRWLNPVI